METSAYPLHDEVEHRLWWFVARRQILARVLADHRSGVGSENILEFGSGTGGNLGWLSAQGRLTALEPNAVARSLSERKFPHVTHVASINEIANDTRFSVIAMLDVLEHLADPGHNLRELREFCTSDTQLLVTVPAHPWLFGKHDRYLHHHRRYTQQQLAEHLTQGGFQLTQVQWLNGLLFPLAVAARAWEHIQSTYAPAGTTQARGMTLPPAWLNMSLTQTFALERYPSIRKRLPIGLSLLAIATPAATSKTALRLERTHHQPRHRTRCDCIFAVF
jgi:SAM-dependent methyltransferase